MTDDFYPREARLVVGVIGVAAGLGVIGLSVAGALSKGYLPVLMIIAAFGSVVTGLSAMLAVRNIKQPRYRRGFGENVGER